MRFRTQLIDRRRNNEIAQDIRHYRRVVYATGGLRRNANTRRANSGAATYRSACAAHGRPQAHRRAKGHRCPQAD